MFNFAVRPRLLIIQQGKGIDGHIGKLLKKKSCQVEETDNLDKGMSMIKTLPFDAVVLDLDQFSEDDHFPQFVKGYDLGPPLILVGDSSQKYANEKRLNYQIHDYLVRPVSDVDLNKVVQDIMDRRLLLKENRLLRQRLKILEKHTNHLFSKLEDRVIANTREIAEKKEVIQKIFNLVDGEIILVDKNYHIVQANNAEIAKTAWEQGQENNYFKVMGLGDNTEDCPGCQAMKKRKAVSMERIVVKDKPRYIRQTAIPVFGSRQEEVWGFVQLNQDVTEEKLAQQKQIASEKIKIIEKLAAFFSCNLQTLPLIARNNINRLKKKLKKNDTDLKDCLQLLEKQIVQAEEYIVDLIPILNNELGNVTLVNVNDLLQATLSLHKQGKSPEGIKIVFEQGRDLPLIKANRFQLAGVFTHLINNALDSMPAGGKLNIITRGNSFEVEIEFSDNGPGVPEDIRLKIFEPFFTTKANRLGLGLYICKSIIEKYRGKITLNSNKMTSFIINLPTQYL